MKSHIGGCIRYAKRIGKYTLEIENDVRILNNAAIVGHKEAEGPLAKYFDKTYSDDKFGESSWEKAESFLQKSAVELALKGGYRCPKYKLYFRRRFT